MWASLWPKPQWLTCLGPAGLAQPKAFGSPCRPGAASSRVGHGQQQSVQPERAGWRDGRQLADGGNLEKVEGKPTTCYRLCAATLEP
jgi:hypothetical protein